MSRADLATTLAESEAKDARWAEREGELSELRQLKLGPSFRKLQNLRFRTLGDASTVVAGLRQQLAFRDAQIGKLTQTASMLHVELGRYARMEVNFAFRPLINGSLSGGRQLSSATPT